MEVPGRGFVDGHFQFDVSEQFQSETSVVCVRSDKICFGGPTSPCTASVYSVVSGGFEGGSIVANLCEQVGRVALCMDQIDE